MKQTAIPVLIYGTCNWARLLLDELGRDPRWRIAGVTCDPAYFDADEVCGYPLYPFEGIEKRFPPEKFRMLACGIYASPRERAAHFLRAKAKNYTCANFISLRAAVSPTAVFGENNFVFAGACIDARCRFGCNNIVRPNAYVGHETQVGDTVFFGPGCNVASRCRLGDRTMLGIGSTLVGGLTLGEEVLVGAGALMLKDAPALGKYFGVPARRMAEIDPETGIRMDK